MTAIIEKNTVLEQLQRVKDPEIDTVSIIDLGMVERIDISVTTIEIEVLPTFLGCPALPIIQKEIELALLSLPGILSVMVRFVHTPPWTSDRITQKGHEGLRHLELPHHHCFLKLMVHGILIALIACPPMSQSKIYLGRQLVEVSSIVNHVKTRLKR